ncbi:11037_t:CDS:2 [Dentiscutata erythropus]|uniref:11037_t:CDS:1 n=1 Tax=Dentiscutata erythropus TaxID=1348616 RepID=A0A9N9BKM3_9GLOM|nr:11037_t:CDS:2 [Dentiscutata erythropus]
MTHNSYSFIHFSNVAFTISIRVRTLTLVVVSDLYPECANWLIIHMRF